MSETTLIIATQSKLHVCVFVYECVSGDGGDSNGGYSSTYRNQYKMTKKGRNFASTHFIVCTIGGGGGGGAQTH